MKIVWRSNNSVHATENCFTDTDEHNAQTNILQYWTRFVSYTISRDPLKCDCKISNPKHPENIMIRLRVSLTSPCPHKLPLHTLKTLTTFPLCIQMKIIESHNQFGWKSGTSIRKMSPENWFFFHETIPQLWWKLNLGEKLEQRIGVIVTIWQLAK